MNFKSEIIGKLLKEKGGKEHESVRECLLSICLGNELMVEQVKDERAKEGVRYEYSGASTDELALVYFAK